MRPDFPTEAIAIAAIVLGVIVIVFPHLLAWFIGLSLVLAGVWGLALAFASRKAPVPQEESVFRDA